MEELIHYCRIAIYIHDCIYVCRTSFINFRVLYVDGLTSELIGDFPLDTLPHKGENISVIIPCGVFSRGGIYTLRLQYKYSTVAARHNTAITGLPEIEVSTFYFYCQSFTYIMLYRIIIYTN